MWTLFLILTVPLLLAVLVMVLLMAWLVWRRLRPQKRSELLKLPSVCVVVPHYNEQAQHLLQALDALDAQTYRGPLEVFVVDDGSKNGIQAEIAPWFERGKRQHTFHSVVLNGNSGSKGKAIDRVLPELRERFEVLVILDSDTHVEPSGVERLVERMWQDERCAAVCGFIVPANHEESFLARLQYFEHIGLYPAIKSAQDGIGRVSIMAGAFVAHRMSVVREIGGFGRWIVEDIAWTWAALAAGYSTGYAPDAVAHTYCPTTWPGLLRQRRRWARGRVEAFRAALEVSPSSALRLSPLFILWVLSLSPPTLCLLPVLAAVFSQWWVFGVMVAVSGLYLVLFQIYQAQIPRALRRSVSDILRSTFYNSLFELIVWRPNLLGAWDEVSGQRKVWMTR